MSDEFEKYAVYWVPKRTNALARFGASWTGWCAEQGERRSRVAFGGLSVDIAAITKHSRRHGFHAVIKAPFRLGAGRSRFSLEHVLGLLVEDSVSFQLPRLRLAMVGGCVALVPSQGSPALGDLVSRVGEALAPLDAAVPANGFAEARTMALAPDRNGVATADPVIKFPAAVAHRFHLPLTDPIGPELALEVMEKLQPVLEPILQEPRQLHDLALMGDPGEGRPLRVLLRYDLRDWPLRKTSGAMPCQGPHVLVANFNDPLARSEIAI
jgi:hypothetical protein